MNAANQAAIPSQSLTHLRKRENGSKAASKSRRVEKQQNPNEWEKCTMPKDAIATIEESQRSKSNPQSMCCQRSRRPLRVRSGPVEQPTQDMARLTTRQDDIHP